MKQNQVLRLTIDAGMLLMLLVVMGYSLTGNTVHEWMGISLTLLCLWHLLLNRRWLSSITKGKYRWQRVVSLVVNSLLILSFLLLVLASLPISYEVFPFIHSFEEELWPSYLHSAAAHWFFLLAALHLGMQWTRIKKHLPKAISQTSLTLRVVQGLLAGYGVYAFWTRGIVHKLSMNFSYDFGRPDASWIRFLSDFGAIFLLFGTISYYLLRQRKPKK